MGIYFIRNTVSGKLYIGSSVNIHTRWQHHRSALRHGKHTNPKLMNSWNQHGESAFEFGVLEEVDDRDLLISREDYYILSLSPFFNCCLASEGGRYIPSPEAKARMAAALKGRKFTAEHKSRISAGLMGRVVTPPTRAKIGASASQRHHSEVTKSHLADVRRGWVHSEATKVRIRESNRGKHQNDGENNPRYDSRVYCFQHVPSGKIFQGTRRAFYLQEEVSQGMVSELVRGKRSSVKGWTLG